MARVLLIGSGRERASGLRSLLRNDGHHVTWLRTIQDWRIQEREQRPDVVVAAVNAPDTIFAVEGPAPSGFAPPLLLVQQEQDFPRHVFLEERLVDRLASPFMEGDLLSRIDALVRVRQIVLRGSQCHRPPGQGARSAGIGPSLLSWLRGSPNATERPSAPYLEVAARLAEWSDRRDAFKPGHAERVSSYCAMIAETLDFDDTDTCELLRASMLHDIGKVALPIEVLRQREPLDDQQMQLIRTHPAKGAALLRSLDPDERVAKIVLHHHERPDGTGYYGKPREVIPKSSCALAVAEAYDAMTNSLLREQLTPEYALGLLESRKDTAYDGDCVEALSDHLRPRNMYISVAPAPVSLTVGRRGRGPDPQGE